MDGARRCEGIPNVTILSSHLLVVLRVRTRDPPRSRPTAREQLFFP